MNDRELLEMAAKAAGIDARWWNVKQWDLRETPAGKCKFSKGVREVFGTHHAKPWTPLTSDADAFRLAVDLKMVVDIQEGIVFVHASNMPVYSSELAGEDKHAATRRAITRAAAAIGAAK